MYNMNRRGRATIKTPVGIVEGIKADNIVRQGTIPGPKLCAVNTDKINEVGRKCYTYIGPRVKIQTLTFVDDIQNASSNVSNTIKTANNLEVFERTKGYTFSIDRKKTAILIVGKKKNKKYEVVAKVKNGNIVATEEYKYLGTWYNEKYNHKLSISKMKEKIGYFIQKIKQYGNEYKIGKYAVRARIKIHTSIVIRTIYHEVEAWSNITKTDMEELETIQKRIVCGMCEMMRSTPYIGLLAELGIWPVEQFIHYKQIMLLHNIINSDKRLIKEIVEDQIANTWTGCWYEGVEQTCIKYGVTIDEVRTWNKYKCKQIVKERIEERINIDFQASKQSKTKLRFIEEFGRKNYIEELEYKDCVTMLKVRLNMVEVKCNFKGNFNDKTCQICKQKQDTTEHLLECSKFDSDRNYLKNEEINIAKPNENLAKFVRHMIKSREDQGSRIKFGFAED